MTSLPLAFTVDARADGDATDFVVTRRGEEPRRYRVGGGDPGHYEQFYDELARDFGMRRPRHFEEVRAPAAGPP